MYCREIACGQEGLSVALVGNGSVKGRGREIDSHDIVIRVNAAYNWMRDAEEDGLRLDWWVGRGGMDMIEPERYLDPSHPRPAHSIRHEIRHCSKIISITHNNLEAGFVSFVLSQAEREKYLPLLSTPYVFDTLDREKELVADCAFANIVFRKRYHHQNTSWGGLWSWDLLFTGVQACVLIAIGRPSHLSLYGFDFYSNTQYTPWDMHSMSDALAVLDRCTLFCKAVGIKFTLSG
jgi:hypothetical protein